MTNPASITIGVWLEGLAPEAYSRYRHNGYEDNAVPTKRTIMGRRRFVRSPTKLDFGT